MKSLDNMKKKTVTYGEIQEFFKIDSYLELVDIINNKVEFGELVGVKSSGHNGKRPILFNKYRRVKSIDENLEEELRNNIKYNFHIGFDKSFYLNNLDKYVEDREYIKSANNFYINRSKSLEIEASINERSFQIFGEEKFLKSGRGFKLLKNLGVEQESLNIYYTPEPFVYYSINKLPNQVVLIIENKDTWYTMRKLMQKGQNVFFGVKIDTVIYGAGKGIEKSLEEYYYIVEEYLHNPVKVLYWGDIDYEGFGILIRLINRYKDTFEIEAFKEAYSKMIEIGKNTTLPKAREKQLKVEDINFEVEEILSKGYYIPQEIISYAILESKL